MHINFIGHIGDKNDCTTNKYLRSIYIHTYNNIKKTLLMTTNRPTVIIICLVYQHISFFLDRLQYEILVSRVADFFLSTNEIYLNMGLDVDLVEEGRVFFNIGGERFFSKTTIP